MSRRDWIAVVLIAVTVGLYAPTARHGYISLDDAQYVSGNDHVRAGLTGASVRWAFGTHAYASNWHPLTWLSHMLDIELFGVDNPGAQHAVNVLLHVLSTVLLLLVFHALTGDDWASGFVAAGFALHPQHVESVAWIAERKDVLAGFFWMLTMWAYSRYVQRGSRGFYGLTVVAFALGLLAKPLLVTLPCVLLLLDVWPLGRVTGGPGRGRCIALLMLEKVPLFALTVGSCFITMRVQREAMTLMKVTSLGERIGIACVSYVRYLGDLVWPVGLAVYYPHPGGVGQGPLAAGRIAAAVAVLVVVTAFALFAARHGRHYVIVGWLWFLGTLVPMIGIVQVGGAALADRYTYVPSIGIAVMVAWGAADLVRRGRVPGRAVAVAAAAVILAWTVLTYRQVKLWASDLELFGHTVAVTHNNSVALTVLGGALHRAGRLDEAAERLRAAIQIDPTEIDARMLLGFLELGKARYPAASTLMREVLRLDQHNVTAMMYLGQAEIGAGNTGAGLEELRRCLALDPDAEVAVEAHGALAAALSGDGELAEAVVYYEALLRLAPETAWAINNLGWIRATNPALSDPGAAVALAKRLCPDIAACDDPGQLDTVGAAYAATGDFARAIVAVERALSLVAVGDEAGSGLRAELEARLALYRSGVPFRDPPPGLSR